MIFSTSFAQFDMLGLLAQILVVIGGLLWVVTYVLIIRKGFAEKSYGIPWAAVTFNISWELIFGFSSYKFSGLPLLITYAWLVLDVIIAFLIVRYGRQSEAEPIRRILFYPCLLFMLSTAVTTQYSFLSFTEDPYGTELAFIINLLMAILYLSLLFNRPDLTGLSYPASYAMTLGTLLNSVGVIPNLSIYLPGHDSYVFMYVLFVGIFVFNVVYIVLFTRQRREISSGGS